MNKNEEDLNLAQRLKTIESLNQVFSAIEEDIPDEGEKGAMAVTAMTKHLTEGVSDEDKELLSAGIEARTSDGFLGYIAGKLKTIANFTKNIANFKGEIEDDSKDLREYMAKKTGTPAKKKIKLSKSVASHITVGGDTIDLKEMLSYFEGFFKGDLYGGKFKTATDNYVKGLFEIANGEEDADVIKGYVVKYFNSLTDVFDLGKVKDPDGILMASKSVPPGRLIQVFIPDGVSYLDMLKAHPPRYLNLEARKLPKEFDTLSLKECDEILTLAVKLADAVGGTRKAAVFLEELKSSYKDIASDLKGADYSTRYMVNTSYMTMETVASIPMRMSLDMMTTIRSCLKLSLIHI